MPEAPPPRAASAPAADQGNLLIGRMAIERGLVTKEQLQECLREQARDSGSPGGRGPRSLGVMLVAKGYLTDAQLVALLDEQKTRRPAAGAAARQEDALLGKLFVRERLANAAQVNECLRLQAEAEAAGGAVPRLGELLVQKGHATREAVARVLALQQKTILACPQCGMKYNVAGYVEGRDVRCKKCNEPLVPPGRLDSVHVDGSAPAMPPVTEGDLPADVAAAAKNPLSHFGKYILVKELGRGGMGVVYKAWQTDLRRIVALKLLSSRSSSSVGVQPSATDDEVKRFYREAQTAAKLKHANIVSIIEVGQHNGHYFLTMEFIDGATLERWVRSGKLREGDAAGGRPSRSGAWLRRAAEIVRDVSLAVQAAHDQQIIHRDLKPQNILMDVEGRPHVTDFGLAKSMHAKQKDAATLTVSGIILGTPAYMSPEQASGGKVKLDARSDVYSLGAILYECLTGRTPFTGNSSLDIVMQVIKSEPPPPSQVAKHPVPKEIETICVKAMEKDRERRYPTAKAFADDLERWLQGESIVARPQTAWYRLQKKVRTNPVLASALAAAAVAGIALAAIALTGDDAAARNARRLEEAVREGQARLKKEDFAGARIHFEQALALHPDHAEARKGLQRAQREEEEERRRRDQTEQKLAALQREMEELRRKREQATTDEEKAALARQEADAQKELAALTTRSLAPASTVRPPGGAVTPVTPVPAPPTEPVKPPPAPVAPPTEPPPAVAAIAPPVPFGGDGPKLLAAHRYGEMYDRLRRDRKAYGAITDFQVSCVRAGSEVWETLQLNLPRFKERKPRLALPILKTVPDLADATLAGFDVARGNIDLQVRMRDGGTGTISESIPGLQPSHLVDLLKVCAKDDDPAAQERYGRLYALHGDHDNALTCLVRARQLGATADDAIASVAAAACVPPPRGATESPLDVGRRHERELQELLKKYGGALPGDVRSRLEEASAACRASLAAGEADDLWQKADEAARARRFADAHGFIDRLLQQYPDSPAAGRARELARSVPHPDGRLLAGFEGLEEMRDWGKSPNAQFERVLDPARVKEGAGALKLTLTGQVRVAGEKITTSGSFIACKVNHLSLERVRSINLWVRGEGAGSGQVLFGCYTSQNDYFFTEFRVDPQTWKPVRLARTAFDRMGKPDWRDITLIGFTYFENGTRDVLVDSIRLQE